MKLVVDDKNYTPCPQGSWPAMCIKAVDLGLQDTHFGEKHQIYLQFETNQREGDHPCSVGTTVTASMASKATLRKLLTGWRGKPYSPGEEIDLDQTLANMLGKPVTVLVEHDFKEDGAVYAKLRALSPSDKSWKPETDVIGMDNYLEGPDWLIDKIDAGKTRLKNQGTTPGQMEMFPKMDPNMPPKKVEQPDDEVPFL